MEDQIHTNHELKKLIMYISHPYQTVKSHTKLVPFCFTGYEAEKFNKELIDVNITNLNYEFCNESFQRLTDIGICTTFNVKENLKYPSTGESIVFEKGINLILDSSSYKNDLRKIQDFKSSEMYNAGKLEHIYTPFDPYNGHTILIHKRDEVPMFLGPQNTINVINPNTPGSQWVKEIRFPIQLNGSISCSSYLLHGNNKFV